MANTTSDTNAGDDSTKALVQVHAEAEALNSPSIPDNAMKVRAIWMREMGLSEAEVQEFCNPGKYPADLQEEIENLSASERLQNLDISRIV